MKCNLCGKENTYSYKRCASCHILDKFKEKEKSFYNNNLGKYEM